MVKFHTWCEHDKQQTTNNKHKEKYNMMNETNNNESSIAVENQRTVIVGSLKAGNSVKVVIDKNALYTVGQVIELAGFAVPESVRTESGIIGSTELLPDNCTRIALGISNVKAGLSDDVGEYADEDDEDDEDEDDDDESPRIVSNPVSEDIPCEYRRTLTVGSLKAANSVKVVIDKRCMYTVGQVIEAAGFSVPESVRTESGIIGSTELLPDNCSRIALGISNVKAGL